MTNVDFMFRWLFLSVERKRMAREERNKKRSQRDLIWIISKTRNRIISLLPSLFSLNEEIQKLSTFDRSTERTPMDPVIRE